jgi:hypothetical protein
LTIGVSPINSKLKELNKYQATQEPKFIDSYWPKPFKHALSLKAQELQPLIAQVKKELRELYVHLYLLVYIIWARKP